MGNAIRYLKDCVVKVDPELSEMEAKQQLLEQVDDFIRERITAAGTIIARETAKVIADGDVILTFAKSSIVERVLLEANQAGKRIRVIVIDSKPLFESMASVTQSRKAERLSLVHTPC
jgi:translation initiation factor eIF-2B subunit delta